MTMCTLNHDGSIHAVAMWYGFLDGSIAIETKAKAQKAINLARDPRITCMFEDGDYYEELRGVELVGRAEIVDDPDKMFELGVDLFERYYGAYTEELRPVRRDHAQQADRGQGQRGAHRLVGPPQARPAPHPPGLSRAGRTDGGRHGPPPMSDDELLDFLDAEPAHTAKLATVRADGRPHVAPVWFALDPAATGDGSPIGDIVFNTGADTVKGKALRRDPRVALCVDDERPPFSFVTIEGVATISEELVEVAHWAAVIGGRYMGAERAEEYGRRNGVPGELLVRVRPTHIVAVADLAG